jgi:hypothetical protein
MGEATRSKPKQCAGTCKDGIPCTARVMVAGDAAHLVLAEEG